MRTQLTRTLALSLCLTVLAFDASAARDAWVKTVEAVIWSDVQRSGPLGYVRRGRKLRVGDENQQRGEVVPLVVSGRIAYVSLADLTFNPADERVYTRFQDAGLYRLSEQVVLSGTMFNGTESTNKNADRYGDSWDFRGGTLKGLARTEHQHMDLGVLLDFFSVARGDQQFKIFEFGLGVSYAVIDALYLKWKLEAYGLLVPWAQYSWGGLFSTNGFGFGGMAQTTVVLFGGNHWGVEGALGMQLLQLFDIKPPPPFPQFDPGFIGMRASLGVVRRY
jgi:hypothetical protein